MTLTAAHVERVLRSIPGAYGRQVASLDVLARGANEALRTAPTDLTVRGAAAFLATMAQESASFRATEEYAKHGRYAPFIGRTFEMVTWRDNYERFGSWCVAEGLLTDPHYFTEKPERLAAVRWAWLGGVWFWQKNGIWAWANRGDFLATQRAVNLGSPTSKNTPVGMTVRNAWYRAWLNIGADLLPDTSTGTAPAEDPTTEGWPKFMDDIYVNFASAQPLVPGDNEISVSATSKTLVIGPSKGVDALATIDVRDAAGDPYRAHPVYNPAFPTDLAAQAATTEPQFLLEDQLESFFRVVSYKDKTATTTISSRRPTHTDQVAFKGSISDDVTGRSPRLRLVVRVPDGVEGLTLASVQITGWKL